jgi:ABC-type Mn2+/Zn2+ transport system permease subunit
MDNIDSRLLPYILFLTDTPLYTVYVCVCVCVCVVTCIRDDFGGLVVSIPATGTRVRGFKPGRIRWIFRASKKSSVCLPSEEK